jgi:hypothetical protein
VYLGNQTSDVPVEAHYYLVSQQIVPMTDETLEWFWSQTVLQKTPFGQIRILTPEATLVHLALHDVLQHDKADLGGFGSLDGIKLRRKYDMHRLLSKYDLDWELVITQARKLRREMAVEQALIQSKYLFNTRFPEKIISSLGGRPTIATLPIERRQQRHYLRTFARLPWRARLKYVWSAVFLPQEVMRERYQIADDVQLGPYYIKRLWHLLRQAIKELWTA